MRHYHNLNIEIEGEIINGTLGLNTNNPKNKLKLAIILHGLLNEQISYVVQGIENGIEESYCTYAFDFKGNGLSQGESTYSDYDLQKNDLFKIIRYFQTKYIKFKNDALIWTEDNTDIGFNLEALIGHSKGGSVILMLLSDLKLSLNIPFIINVSGRVDLRVKNLRRFTKQQLDAVEQDDKIVWKLGPKSRPIYLSKQDFIWRDKFDPTIFKNIILRNDIKGFLTIHGQNDEVVNSKDALLLKEILQDKYPVFIMNEVGHFFNKKGQIELLNNLINQYLKGHSIKL